MNDDLPLGLSTPAERDSRELVHQLQITLESISDAFFTLDLGACFTYVNSRAEKVLGMRRNQLLGKNIWEVFPDTVGSVFQTEYERAMAKSCTVTFETHNTPLGVWLSVTAYPMAHGLAVHLRDVTAKHATEQRLVEERETLRAVVNTTSDGIVITDSQGLIQLMNPAAEYIFGRSQESLQDQAIELLLPVRYRAAHREHRQRFVASGASHRMMGLGIVKGLHADGQEVDLEGTIAQLDVQGKTVLIVGLRNVVERLSVEARFQKSRAQLASLTHRLMTQEKSMVKGLAQVMHDQMGQTMAAIRMAHETIVTVQAGKVSPDLMRLQTHLGALIDQAIRQVRQVLVDLRPPLLEEHGLPAALDNELRNRSAANELIDITMDVPQKLETVRWTPEVEYAAFMVAREAIENALRHSGASFIFLRMTGSPRSFKIEIRDDGVGIKKGSSLPAGHLGILGMQERASAVGAILKIDADEGSGTKISFSWQSAMGWVPSI